MPVKFVTWRVDLKKTDSIDWKKVVKDDQSLPFKNHEFVGKTIGGLGYRILNPLLLVGKRQGRTATWVGNFKQGDGVLATNHDIGPLVITFDQAVHGAGAQIQADGWPRDFKGRIQAFDAAGTRVAQYDRDGTSNNLNDDSAIFIGVLSDIANIKRIEMSTVSINPSPGKSTDFAINQLDLHS